MKFALRAVALVALALCCTTMAYAQGATTGAIGGVVTDASNAALPGVAVEAIHEPTGTRYTTVTDSQGRFRMQNVRVGGPYAVSVSLEGFNPQQTTDIYVNLGEQTYLTYSLNLETVTETVTVVGESNPLISPSRTGAASNVSQETIEDLPTLDRSFNDFARTNPFVVPTGEGDSAEAISFAGRNTRYNNIQIDGAVNNDLFGLADSGTPGGQAETTPISLDAIQEIQLVMASYDVRNGGFSGGSLNAITRSGSNSHKGSLYYFSRSDSMVGDGPEELGEPGKFDQQQYGFRIGGPISQDSIFYFVNADFKTEDLPTGWSISGNSGQCFGGCAPEVSAAATRFENLLSQYGFSPGTRDEQTRDLPSDKAFVRFDFNLAEAHQLTARWNYVDASNVVNFPSSFTYEWPTESYDFTSETNSFVAQLNSVFGTAKFNEARVTYQTVKDRRHGVVEFPWIEIEDIDPVNGFFSEFETGTEPFSTRNALDQNIIEITDDFTWIMGNHTLTLGTSNQFFDFDNLFIQNAYGSYQFSNLDQFETGIARQWDYTVVNPGQPDSQKFGVNQWGFYAGDVWAAKPNLTLTYGLRVDVPFFPDKPSFNPAAQEIFGVDTSEMPDGEQLWQPRIGANWDVNGDGKQQVRGGIGIFAGRTPYVWISNQYARTGIEQTFYTFRDVPFNPDPYNQTLPDDASGTGGEFNFIDPSFKMPSLWRINAAYDRELPWWNLIGTAEILYSQTVDDVNFRDLNIVQTGNLGFDGRPVFGQVDSDYSGAYQITNTGDGDATNFMVKIERPYRRGVWGYVSYAYGESNVVNDGTSSRAVSNFQFNEALDPNNPPTSRSDFSVEHRFNASVSYRFNAESRWPTTLSGFYNLQSGRPYMYIYGRQPFLSINTDNYYSNDLLYVPASPDDVEFSRGTWDEFNAYVEGEECLRNARGGIIERNSCDSPWFESVDIRVAQDIPIRQTHLQITFDLFNLLNLFDRNSGVVRYVPFGTLGEVNYEGTNAEGKPIYALSNVFTDPENNDKFDINNTRSRWRGQIGVRWSF